MCICHMVWSGMVSLIKMACGQRSVGKKGGSHVAVWEKNIKDRGSSKCKGSATEMCLAGLRNSKVNSTKHSQPVMCGKG